MKAANLALLGLLLLMFVPGMLTEPRAREGLIGVGLILIPGSFLIACYWKGQKSTLQQFVKFGVIYNGAAALVLLVYVATSGVSHPVAFAIRDQVLSFLLCILAALNFWTFREWYRRIGSAQ